MTLRARIDKILAEISSHEDGGRREFLAGLSDDELRAGIREELEPMILEALAGGHETLWEFRPRGVRIDPVGSAILNASLGSLWCTFAPADSFPGRTGVSNTILEDKANDIEGL